MKKRNLSFGLFTLLCLSSCNKSPKLYDITFIIDGEEVAIIKVSNNGEIIGVPEIENKTGYDSYWSINGDVIEEGNTFTYSENVTATINYVPHKWKIVFDDEDHTKLDVTYDQKIGDGIPLIPSKVGYTQGSWEIEGTTINKDTIYRFDKNTFANAKYDKLYYKLSFEGLDESHNITLGYGDVISSLPDVPEYQGDLKDYYIGVWTLNGEVISENVTSFNFASDMVAKPYYYAFLPKSETKEEIDLLNSDIRNIFDYKNSGDSLMELMDDKFNTYVDVTNKTFKLTWEEIKAFDYYLVSVSLDENMLDKETYLTFQSFVNLSNLKANATYYYQIEGFVGDKSILSSVFSFKTKEGPTTIDIDGVVNMRDIGSYKTTFEGKSIKQGLIYRSGNIDSISEKGKRYAIDVLKIKTELDLREEGYWLNNTSYFGDEVTYKHVSNTKGGVYYLSRGVEGDETGLMTGGKYIKEELSVFLNKDNYPIDFHCMIGRDRTGTLAAILQALLGVSEQDIYFDFVYSFFATGANPRTKETANELYRNIVETMSAIKSWTGEANLSKAVEKYLTYDFTGSLASYKVGLTIEEVNTIKSIMLEDK